jgi:hypothetical protein
VEDYDEDESFDEILADTKRRLTSHARAMFDSVMKSNEEHNRAGLNTVIASCKKPVFVSSMAYNMSKKAKADYDEQEKIVYASLNEYGALDEDESLLGKIGNMDEVRGLFDEVGRNKNETLKAKAMDFVPKTKLQLKVVLDKYAELVNSKLDVLKNNDRDAIEKQKDTVLKRKNAIVAEVEGIFGETLEGIETQKIETTNFLRNMQAESTKLEEHIEEKWISKQVRVSDSVWWNPFSWFSSHIEDRGYMEHTSYLDAADAVNNINDFIAQAQNEIESIFKDKVNTSAIKSKLIRSVVDNFDVADEKFDPNFFRIIVENNVSRISFPVINFNTDSIRSQVIDNFQGRVKDEAKANELRKALNKAISEVFSLTLTTMTNTVSEFRDKLFELKDEVSAGFIADITEEYNAILSQCEQKNNEIERLEQLLQLLDNANK